MEEAAEQIVELGAKIPDPSWVTIVTLLGHGLTTEQIAKKTRLSVNTIKTKLGRIYRRLGAGNAAQAVYRAMEEGWFRDSHTNCVDPAIIVRLTHNLEAAVRKAVLETLDPN